MKIVGAASSMHAKQRPLSVIQLQVVRQSRRVYLPLASGSPAAECPMEGVLWRVSAETSGTVEGEGPTVSPDWLNGGGHLHVQPATTNFRPKSL